MAEQQVKKTKEQGSASESEEDLLNTLLDDMEDGNADQKPKESKNTNNDEVYTENAENDDDDLNIKDLLDDMEESEEDENKQKEEEEKMSETQRRYFENIHSILTELDITEIDEDENNKIELDELKNWIKANNIQIPIFLIENVFHSIDDDGNGSISPLEYLRWKVRVTVEDIAAISSNTATSQPQQTAAEPTTPTAEVSVSDDIDDVLGMMEEEEKDRELQQTITDLEAAKKRKDKELEIERKRKAAWMEKERIRKEKVRKEREAEEERIRKEREKLDEEKKKLEKERQRIKEEERDKQRKKIEKLQHILDDDDKDGDDSGEDGGGTGSASDGDGSESLDLETSTESSDWDDLIAFNNGANTLAVEESTCSKFFPCCAKPTVLGGGPGGGGMNKQIQENMGTKIIKTKTRLSRFILRNGDRYKDDHHSMNLKNDKLEKLTRDVDFNDKLGVWFWSIVIDKQSQKAYDCLWPVLRYTARELPTPVAVELINLYRVELSRYPPAKIEGITHEVVEASSFPVATALVFAAYFQERASSDLANTRQLSTYSDMYCDWAAEELRTIESDYLASMAMFIKSFHDNKTPFEIAVENELVEFLASDRVGRISHAMYVKNDLLTPQISDDSFEVRDTGLMAVIRELPSPKTFYFTPIGFHFTETFLFVLYLGIFTIITLIGVSVEERPIRADEWVLYVCNFGYVFNEILQFLSEGPSQYFSTWENAVDIIVSVNWILIMFLRIFVVLLTAYLPADTLNSSIFDGIDTEDSTINLIFKFLWVLNIILLWIRCIHFLMLSNKTGPLINVTKSMAGDVKNWVKVAVIISVGFLYAMYFLVGDSNEYFDSEINSLTFTILAMIGQPNWLHVYEGSGDSITEFDVLTFIHTWIVVIYSIIGFVLLFNLLIAMMAESYSRTEGQSAKEVLLNKNSLSFELDAAPKIMPPPFNSLLFVLFVLYNVVDILLLAFTAEFINEQGLQKYWRCRNKDCKFLNKKSVIDEQIKQGWDDDFPCGLCDTPHPMVDIAKSSKRRFRRKARGLEGAKHNFCSRIGRGLKEIFVSKIKWKKHSWSCGYCRNRIPPNNQADLERYFKLLRQTHNLDSNDVNWIKSMNPQLCPFCYRPRKPRARSTYILENISYIIFLLMIYPMMWFIFWPIYLYDTIKNPNKAKKDYKEFRLQFIKLYSLRPDAEPIRKNMPKAYVHQSILSLHHDIWRSLHHHRSTLKTQTLAQSILSANTRQENVREQNENTKRKEIQKISNLVMDVVNDLSNIRIKWEPSGADLLNRMSTMLGSKINLTEWWTKKQTVRAGKESMRKLQLEMEGGVTNRRRNRSTKLNISTGSLQDYDEEFDGRRKSSHRTSKKLQLTPITDTK